jgi:hypothetical protein
VASLPAGPYPGSFGETFFYAPQTGTPQPGFHMVTADGFYLAAGMELGPMLFVEVPEPSTLSVAAIGTGLTLLRGRRRA